ncbi:MAG: hypothetical protein M2R45_00086 [Verrucomicrobia subdivision 3 bacterium]|nr:hypothetical protein [Limisphaerales bacterium]MCS1412456.1 hypothetical protein [Limisphaerales bacterium]
MKRFLTLSNTLLIAFVALAVSRTPSAWAEPGANPYAPIDALFAKHCLDCHSHDDPDAQLNLETYETLIKGGQNGSPILKRDSARSPLVRLLVGFTETKGKKRIMPPGRREKLTTEEINLVRTWIDLGAPGPPAGWRRPVNLIIPEIAVTGDAPNPAQALAYSPVRTLLAIGRYRQVDLLDTQRRVVVKCLDGHRGNVNGLVFSSDGATLYSAAGEPGLSGEIKKWNTTTGDLLQTMSGHTDSIYSLALSPDGSLLATGSYDQQILLWNTAEGTRSRTLSGHQGAVFDLDFRPDGKILASASADRTIKLWNVTKGERTDTLSQPLKAQHTVLFSQDGRRLYAGGVDNRIRVWEISKSAKETTNPILKTRFAHEGTILKLSLSQNGKTIVSTADDRTVKLWDIEPLKERFLLETQPDWSPAIVFFDEDKKIAVGRLDGTIGYYQSQDGKVALPPKPEIARLSPFGVQRGILTHIRVEGKNLGNIESINFDSPALHAAVIPEESTESAGLELLVFSPESLELGKYPLTIKTAHGASNKVSLHVDNLPQVAEIKETKGAQQLSQLPVNVWGSITENGQVDRYRFEAEAGQGLVFDVAAKQLGSKGDLVITLNHSNGTPIASSRGFDQSIDPLLFHRFKDSGTYELTVGDSFLQASPDHFYRLSIGGFPYVTDVMPRMITKGQDTKLRLIGFNLSENDHAEVAVESSSTHTVKLDRNRYRFRTAPKIALSEWEAITEAESNNAINQATQIQIGQNATGRIWSTDSGCTDVDYFRFSAQKDQQLIIETIANQLGSPIDTRIEILTASGQPIQRLLLEAVRDTAITFRPITSTARGARLENWEEMSINDYLYMNGEVVKLFLAPRGPDSSWDFYPASGTRRNYFDTTATAHANFEPCYIVRPHAPGTSLVANGLPQFPLFYENDDHSEAGKGRDSRLYFTAPESGDYVVRVVDTRSQASPRFVYHLLVREEQPDFEVTISPQNPSINRGSGRSFAINRQRIDGYDGEIEIEIGGLPHGVIASSPIVIEAGHHRATGTLFVDDSVTSISALESLNIEVTATARIGSSTTIRQVKNFGRIKIADEPKLFVTLSPISGQPSTIPTSLKPSLNGTGSAAGADSPIPVITISPGTTVPARLTVRRNGHKERITFSISNLPHGVIVDNIGLNGVLMPPDVSERKVFLTADDWVEETERLCHAIANEAGGQTSRPVLLRVVKPSTLTAANQKDNSGIRRIH